MATDLDEHTLHALRKAFAVADVERRGSIDPTALQASLASAGVSADSAHLESALSQVTLTDGRVSWDVFLLLAASFQEEEDEEAIVAELREAFLLYDRDGKGFITTKVLREILHELDSKLTEKDMDEIIEDIDEDGRGKIDFNNFKQLML